ncbi:MAG TPA: carboxypeptidase-like regulatory domain-containing protein [Vicinamibacterales bacterium]|nr:carboxypeptidase-like regulatory domain-containing protein [Vicinamibacterales bacterium]
MRRVLVSLTCLVAATTAFAQQAPPRDTSAAAQKGTAVIRGRVVAADSGRPLRRARVSVAGIGLGTAGQRSASTGLDGTFVVKDLPAARYRITVTRGGYLRIEYGQRRPNEQGRPVELADGQTLDKLEIALPRMSGIAGRVTDENGEPIEGVAVYAMRSLFFEGRRRLVPVSGSSVRTDDDGEYRIPRLAPGSYQVMASTKETWTVTDSAGRETTFGYMPTYYPGVAAPTEARRVAVSLGEYVRAIDFQLVPGRAAKVSGTALDSKGRPFSRVSLGEHVRGLGFASFGGGPGGPVAADGTFSVPDVPPGQYTLQASRYGADADGPPEAALMEIFVDGNDVENLMLAGSNGGIVSGKVIAENGTLPKTSGIFITIGESYRNQPPPLLLGAFRENRTGPTVLEDGTFTVSNVFGRARFQVTVPEGWMVKSIRHEGRDISAAVLELKSREQISGVEILITNRVTEIGGQVVDDKNVPVGEATVLLFPVDADRWFENSRSIRATRPDQQGRWQIKTLPAGDYLAVALDYIEVDAWQDPEYLESLRRYAERVTISEAAPRTVSLKVVVPKQ